MRVGEAGSVGVGDERFWALATPLLERPGVTRSTMMGFPCLRLSGDFFAACDRRTGALVVKLDRARVAALLDAGRAEPFAPNGRVFREWVTVPHTRSRSWRAMLDEALACSAARRRGGGTSEPPPAARGARLPTARASLLDRLRSVALALPEVTERVSHGEPCFFVRGRRPLCYFHDDRGGDGRVTLWCPAPPGVAVELASEEPRRFFVPPTSARGAFAGWLGIYLDTTGDDAVDWDEIARVLDDAYRVVAPKALVAWLESG
jgi:hypothetical protein